MSYMGRIKKLSIKRFESAANVENYYNNFSEEFEIVSSDVKLLAISKFKPTYLLILEYLDSN